jgi:ligand-binding sensor domain-containing protein
VSALAALPDGGLWIGYDQGGATLLDAGGRATHYRDDPGLPFGRVRSFARTGDGAVWLSAVGGLARFADGRWHRVREDWGYTCRSANALFVDRAGVLWVGGATPDRLLFLPRGSRRFELTVDGLAANAYRELQRSSFTRC